MRRYCCLLLSLLLVVGCSRVAREPLHPALVSSRWQWSDERATAAWCKQHQTGPAYEAVISGDTGSWIVRQMPFKLLDLPDEDRKTASPLDGDLLLSDGPLRISLQDEGGERFAWRGFDSSVWHVLGPYLLYVEFRPGTPGGSLVLVQLDTGRVRWKVPMGYPMPLGWSMWLNEKMLQVRDDGVHVWSKDGGHFHEVFDLESGRSLGWRRYPGN